MNHRHREALERIATLDGIKGFNDANVHDAAANLFALVCKLKNIAKNALGDDDQMIESEAFGSDSMVP